MGIVIVDCGIGNIRSVYNAFKVLGASVEVSHDPDRIIKAGKLVLPGVGSFSDAVKGLKERRIFSPIKDYILSGKLYLGICLGLQLLFENSEEGHEEGLGFFKGRVRRFPRKPGVKIPHIGWNNLRLASECAGLKDEAYYYFVHSYYADPDEKSIIGASTEYCGVEFTSFISKNNVIATQFHPEKSQDLGLEFLRYFINL